MTKTEPSLKWNMTSKIRVETVLDLLLSRGLLLLAELPLLRDRMVTADPIIEEENRSIAGRFHRPLLEHCTTGDPTPISVIETRRMMKLWCRSVRRMC